MTINKYQGKTKEEAIEKAKQELGENAVVMNVKEIKPKGVLKVFKSSVFEVTAAIEEKEKFANPRQALETPLKMHDGINLTADEKLNVSGLQQNGSSKENGTQEVKMPEFAERPRAVGLASEGLEKKLEDLSNILEKQFAAEDRKIAKPQPEELKPEKTVTNPEGFQFMKMLYRTMLENDVNEKYVNQIMEEAEKVIHNGSSVDHILSNVYQKMILKFGQPHPISLTGKKPNVIFFIGPTGVGKTTTIAKIASKYKVEYGKRVAFLTADTYRIAATEQLRVYANILDSPMSIIYSPEELNDAVARVADYDLVFIDTAGFSHRNEVQCDDMKKLIQGLDEEYGKEVFLVLSATTKYRDLLDIVDTYHEIADYKLIFTKLDETSSLGNLLNIRLYSGADLSYTAYGQNVPDDIEEFNTQKIVKQLLGGR